MDVEKIVHEYIDKSFYISLATVSGDKPWVCEVHFTYDDKLNFYFRSIKSRCHSQETARNPNVTGNIAKQHPQGEYPHAIYFEDSAKIIDDNDEIERAFIYFQTRLGADAGVLDDAKKEEGHDFYKIRVKNWYAFGKFGGPSGQKYKLEWND